MEVNCTTRKRAPCQNRNCCSKLRRAETQSSEGIVQHAETLPSYLRKHRGKFASDATSLRHPLGGNAPRWGSRCCRTFCVDRRCLPWGFTLTTSPAPYAATHSTVGRQEDGMLTSIHRPEDRSSNRWATPQPKRSCPRDKRKTRARPGW